MTFRRNARMTLTALAIVSSLALIAVVAMQGAEAAPSTPVPDGAARQGLAERWGLSPWMIALFTFGFIGQIMFFGRWVVQWYVSERQKRSTVPSLFWWLSLIGASILLIYFLLRRDPVGVVGQAVGWIVYIRNLRLLRAETQPPAAITVAAAPAGGSAATQPIADPNAEI